MQIKSLTHFLVKHWANLRKDSAYRKESNTVLLIGEKMIREFPLPIKCLISEEPVEIIAQENHLVTRSVLEKVSGFKNFGGMLAEVAIPEEKNIDDKNFVLVLDQIQDPGNLGTILRCALALGWEGVVATPGTVDFFNDKALRASQGAIFRLPFAYKTPQEIAAWDRTLWVADAKGTDLKKATFRSPLALVLSNEGQGLSPWAKKHGKPISIPLQNNVESLNVATAGAILLHQIKQ